jgi:hypothetical protein
LQYRGAIQMGVYPSPERYVRFSENIDPSPARRPTYLFKLSRHFEKRVLSETLRQEKGPACAGPSLFLGRKHPTEDPMNVPQAVPLVVAEMSHLQRKARRGNTPAVPE